MQALRILAVNHMTREQMRGSWAGAMGNMQFMPSTFMKWGVDRDGNGRIDLWTSLPDAFASAANFLRGIGFKPGLPSSEEVFLPQGFPLDQADTTIEKPVRAWAAMGVKRAGGAAAAQCRRALVDHPAGRLARARLHPLSQLQGGDELEPLDALCAGGRHPGATDRRRPAGHAGARRPTTSRCRATPWSTCSTRLAKLGLYTDETDGLLGPKTRSAVRLFQKQAGLPADGHPTPDVVRRLQQAAR